MAKCLICGEEIPSDKRSDALYCSVSCRQKAYRVNRRHEQPPVHYEHVVPVPPGRLRNPSVEDVARLVCFTASLEASYRMAAERADYRLRPKCRRMADAIALALDEEGLR